MKDHAGNLWIPVFTGMTGGLIRRRPTRTSFTGIARPVPWSEPESAPRVQHGASSGLNGGTWLNAGTSRLFVSPLSRLLRLSVLGLVLAIAAGGFVGQAQAQDRVHSQTQRLAPAQKLMLAQALPQNQTPAETLARPQSLGETPAQNPAPPQNPSPSQSQTPPWHQAQNQSLTLAQAQDPPPNCSGDVTGINLRNARALFGQPEIRTFIRLRVSCNGASQRVVRLCLGIDGGSGGAIGVDRSLTSAAGGRLLLELARINPAPASLIGVQERKLFVLPLGARGRATREFRIRATIRSEQRPQAGRYSSRFAADIAYDYLRDSNCVQPPAATFPVPFRVRATIPHLCALATSPLDFGSTATAITTAIDATATLFVRCAANTSYRIGLSAGGSGDENKRLLSGPGGARIPYALYQDAGRTQNWGNIRLDGRGFVNVGRQNLSGAGPFQSAAGGFQRVTVYGRIPALGPNNTPPPGRYSDTIIVTLIY